VASTQSFQLRLALLSAASIIVGALLFSTWSGHARQAWESESVAPSLADATIVDSSYAREALEEQPDGSVQHKYRLPLVLSLFISLVLLAFALPSIWRPIVEARANADHAVFWACSVGVSALIYSLEGLVGRNSNPAGLLSFVGWITILVLVGVYIWRSVPPDENTMPSAEAQLSRGWLIGLAGIGLASLSFVLPQASRTSILGFTGPSILTVKWLFLAYALAAGIELGIRPIADSVLHNLGTLARALIVALAAVAWTPFVASGPWWWARFFLFIAVLISALVKARHGRVASLVFVSLFLLAWFVFPGLAIGGAVRILSISVFVLGFAVLPMTVLRIVKKGNPGHTDWPPEYVRSLKKTAVEGYANHLAEELLLPRSQPTTKGAGRLGEGFLLRRSVPPAADVCKVISLGKNRVGIFLAEMPSRGVHGALQASIANTAIEALAIKTANPAKVLAEMHRIISSAWHGDRGIVSASYGILDRKSNSFTFSNAGHQPVLLQRTLRGRLEQISPAGQPIDLAGDEEDEGSLEVISTQLISRDLLIFFSDGLLNATSSDGEEFGMERLEQLVNDNSSSGCSELAEMLNEKLDSFLGKKAPIDDIVVLFLRSG